MRHCGMALGFGSRSFQSFLLSSTTRSAVELPLRRLPPPPRPSSSGERLKAVAVHCSNVSAPYQDRHERDRFPCICRIGTSLQIMNDNSFDACSTGSTCVVGCRSAKSPNCEGPIILYARKGRNGCSLKYMGVFVVLFCLSPLRTVYLH